jgi:phenylalanyl-tRNA synthetase beta subunit
MSNDAVTNDHTAVSLITDHSFNEHEELSMLITAKHHADLKHDPLLEVKRHLLEALGKIGFAMSITPVIECPAYVHPGRYATVSVLGTVVGEIFEVHPDIRERFKLPGRAAVATINVTTLLSMEGAVTVMKALPQFPSVSYDETIKRTHDDGIGDTLKNLKEKSLLLENVEIVDLYDGKPLKQGQFNLTLRFTYRATDKTLTEDEAKKEHTKVLALLR